MATPARSHAGDRLGRCVQLHRGVRGRQPRRPVGDQVGTTCSTSPEVGVESRRRAGPASVSDAFIALYASLRTISPRSPGRAARAAADMRTGRGRRQAAAGRSDPHPRTSAAPETAAPGTLRHHPGRAADLRARRPHPPRCRARARSQHPYCPQGPQKTAHATGAGHTSRRQQPGSTKPAGELTDPLFPTVIGRSLSRDAI